MSWNDAVIRNRHKQILREIFSKDKRFKDDYDRIEDIIEQIEVGCNNAAIRQSHEDHVSPINWSNEDFRMIYSAIFFKVSQNLDPKSPVGSKYLINRIHKGKIDLSELAAYKSDDLCPEKSRKIIEEKNRRLNETIDHKVTERYSCPNCKKNRAQYKQVQLRSLDEGYNTSLDCMECGWHWVV